MKRPEGITKKTDISGSCDICNSDMPPSGGVVTARAMRMLVEGGFDPEPKSGPMASLAAEMEKLGISREASNASMRQKLLREQLGDLGICPDCFQRALGYCDAS
jgi:hypothetical protein